MSTLYTLIATGENRPERLVAIIEAMADLLTLAQIQEVAAIFHVVILAHAVGDDVEARFDPEGEPDAWTPVTVVECDPDDLVLPYYVSTKGQEEGWIASDDIRAATP